MDNVFFSSLYNYQKVANEGTTVVSAPNATTTTYTVTHNLGAITSVRAWYSPATGEILPISEEQYVDDTSFTSEVNLVTVRAYLTTTTLVLEVSNSSGSTKSVSLNWKIYYDS